MPFKVFGRDGTELQLACYKIVSPQRYWILVLCTPGQSDKIVACSSLRVRLKTFLVCWAGCEKGYEKRCCAVRKFGSSLEDVWFSEELWEDEPEDVEPLRLNSGSGVNGSKEEKTQKRRKSINSASRRPAPAPARNSLLDEEESSAEESSPRVVKHTPSLNRLAVKALPEFGPQRPLARHLVKLLEEWHRKNPTGYPPCRYQGLHSSKIRPHSFKSKIFARDGTELELACYKIMAPRNYFVLVLCPSNSPHKIVCCSSQRTKNMTFLVGWAGCNEGYESKCCAVRVFGLTLDRIKYLPDLWDDEPGVAAMSNTPKVYDTKRRSAGSAVRRASPSPSSSSDEEESATDDPSENESVGEGAPRSKRRKSDHHNRDNNNPDNHPKHVSENNNNQSTNTTSSTKETHVVFKLISDFADATRSFPSDECATGKHLFAKSKEFFRLFDQDAEVKVLSCRIPARHERPYLFEGKEGEFRLLLQDLKDSTTGIVNNILTVEIKCVA